MSVSLDTSQLSIAVVLLSIIPTFILGAYWYAQAVKRSRYEAISFLTLIVYGLVVEIIDIRSIENYDYANLLVMVGTSPDWVPLAVGVSWAVIIYTSMQSSDLIGLPWKLRPLLDGAFAVWLDLVMDPVSSSSRWVLVSNHTCGQPTGVLFGGVGLWQWCIPLGAKTLWLSVPLSNFIGWFTVVVMISLALRIGREKLRGDERSAIGQSVLIVTLAAAAVVTVIALAKFFIQRYTSIPAQWTIFAIVMLAPLAMVAYYARRLNFRNPLNYALMSMPILVFLTQPWTFFRRGIDRGMPGARAMFVASVLGSMVVLFLPYLGGLRRGRDERDLAIGEGEERLDVLASTN
jgi:hypothetical protein